MVYSLEYIFLPPIMRDNVNLSNNIAKNKHSAVIIDKQHIVPKILVSSKAKNGAQNFAVTVNNGEKSTIAREFRPIYEI